MYVEEGSRSERAAILTLVDDVLQETG